MNGLDYAYVVGSNPHILCSSHGGGHRQHIIQWHNPLGCQAKFCPQGINASTTITLLHAWHMQLHRTSQVSLDGNFIVTKQTLRTTNELFGRTPIYSCFRRVVLTMQGQPCSSGVETPLHLSCKHLQDTSFCWGVARIV